MGVNGGKHFLAVPGCLPCWGGTYVQTKSFPCRRTSDPGNPLGCIFDQPVSADPISKADPDDPMSLS